MAVPITSDSSIVVFVGKLWYYSIKEMAEKNSQFRRKRADTKMGSLEKKYGVDFGVRSDKKLGNYLEEQGYSSLSKLLEFKKNGK